VDPALLTAAHAAAADPTVTVDLVHGELSLREILDLLSQGITAFQYGLELVHRAYCALPFVRAC
jgi:hypothetical protein